VEKWEKEIEEQEKSLNGIQTNFNDYKEKVNQTLTEKDNKLKELQEN